MTDKKFRFLLTCIFTIGASVLIYKKLSKEVLKNENQQHNSISLNKKNTPSPYEKQRKEDIKKDLTDQRNIDSTFFSSDSSKSFADCTETPRIYAKSLNDYKKSLNLLVITPEILTQKNIIFENKGTEVRFTLSPVHGGEKWNIQQFEVDQEGLPIPGKKLQVKNYNQAMSQVSKAIEAFGESKIVEELVNVQIGQHYGSALIVNKNLIKVSIYNGLDEKYLECDNNRCTCESS